MNRGLLEKSLRETWRMTLLYAGVLFAFEAIIAYVLPMFQAELRGSWLEVEFVRKLLEALLGAELGASFGPAFLQAFPWVHPVILSVLWAHEVTYYTRVPAGEIDRGTIDFLLGLPVSRRQVYLCDTVVLLGCGAVLIGSLLLGNGFGTSLATEAIAPEPARTVVVLVNLGALYVAVGGVAYLVTAFCDHRGRAVAIVFVVLLASFLVNLLAQFWEIAQAIRFLSILSYYQPIHILRDDAFPYVDVGVLVAVGAITWWRGGRVFSRRDICTV